MMDVAIWYAIIACFWQVSALTWDEKHEGTQVLCRWMALVFFAISSLCFIGSGS